MYACVCLYEYVSVCGSSGGIEEGERSVGEERSSVAHACAQLILTKSGERTRDEYTSEIEAAGLSVKRARPTGGGGE